MATKKTTKKKKAASPATRKKRVSSKKVTKKKVAKKQVAKKQLGYIVSESGLLVPGNAAKPVPASKLRTGFRNARKEIDSIVDEIVSSMNGNYIISEIELSASFSADGKFMGFGVGGAATMKIKITPGK